MNILVLTPIYPGPNIGNNVTKVVHYFAKEWVKAGENVQVINLPSYFPKLMYAVPKVLKDFLFKKIGVAIPIHRNDKIEKFSLDNVPVTRIPLFKKHPWTMVASNYLERAVKDIIDEMSALQFTPDIIIAHWFDPSLFFIQELKQHYNCKASIVVHDRPFKYAQYIHAADLWGYRKIDTPDLFKQIFPSVKFSFRCKSGIPTEYLNNRPTRDWSHISMFVYVGTLIKRKYADVAIKAIKNSDVEDFEFNIIGEGPLKTKLEKITSEENLKSKVKILGRIERQEILKHLDMSDIFVMISRDEVFGLVYIEAMARGCIVIASKNEGMEGIIESGKNGFLIEAGNEKELTETINKINLLNQEERKIISNNAIKTAESLTDDKVACEYLSYVKELL